LETNLTIQGTTQFSDSQKLTFMNRGKVQSVNVKVGDLIKKGQILATITTDDLDEQVQQARISLDDANQSLQDLLSEYNLELEYLQWQANYDALLLKHKTIDQDHALAQSELQQKIIAAKQQVADAQKAYNDTKADYEELLSGSNSATADLALSSTIRKRNTTFQNAILEVKSIISALQTTLDTFDQRMLLSDTYKYQEKNIYVGAKDVNLKNQSETLFWTISNQLSELTTKHKALEVLPVEQLTNEQILGLYTIVRDIGNNLVKRGEISYEMFKASIENVLYTQAQIEVDAGNAIKNQSQGIGYIQKYSSMVDSLAAIKDDTSLEDTKLKLDKAQTSLEQAQISVNKLELSVEVLITEQEKEKASLADQIETAQRNITKIKRGESLNESKIKQARNMVTQRQNSLNSLIDKYENYRLEANFDGVITQMDIQVGDSIDVSNNTTVKYIYVENNNVLEIVLPVEQVDIVRLKVGMDVAVYLDAYPASSYRGVITEINTIPTTAGGLTTYSVTVMFEKNTEDEVILAGMGGNAKIIISQTKNVMVVPNQAISRQDGKSVVMRWNGTAWANQEVEI
jgi:multidrug efflux pump subunit AcrA (membrane-fusion protein)